MIKQVTPYFARLTEAFGAGWTRFWFTPSDPATVSAIRLVCGLVVVYLHATLSFDLIEFFGPDGLLPVGDILPLERYTFSYLNYLSTPAELWTLHLLGLVVLVLFAAGFWTRATSILAWVVFLSDVNRAPMISGPTDSIAAMVMLYLCLAPCGRRFSIDALILARKGTTPAIPPSELSTAATIATRLIQVHLAMLVAMMGLSQLGGEVWWNGLGMWYLITREQSRLVDFTWLHGSPLVIDFWSHAVVLFELAFALLIWIPLARPLLLAFGLVIWTSLALVTGDITFGLMLCVASLAFVPPAVVRSLVERSGRTAQGAA
ncbi:MAG: hypothetical protein WD063_09400 [Pirellulales bacterium]